MLCKNLRNKIIKIALIATMAISVTVAPIMHTYLTPVVSAASSLDELQEKQEAIKQQKDETNAKLQNLKADQAQQQEYKNALDQQLNNVKQEKYVIQERINVLDAQIVEKQVAIEDKQIEIDENFEQLGQRLNAIYLSGETTTLEVLLHSSTATELMDRMEVVKSITEHDKKLIEQLQVAISEIKEEKAQIEANRDEVSNAKVELDQKQAEINALVEESNRVLEELNANIDKENEHLHALDEQSAEAAAAVDQWFADYYAQKAQEEQEKQNNNSGNSGNGGTNNSGGSGNSGGSTNGGSSNGGSSGGGGTNINGGMSSSGWMWPAPGTNGLTSDFSDGRNHGAWDIASGGCSGNPIVAAKSGTVMNTMPDPYGYGNYVMIDHGGGYITVYGHMSSKVAMPGQHVEQGQVIGYIGSTGQSTGPHLHFEVRYMGVKQDPYNYYSDIYGSLTKYF